MARGFKGTGTNQYTKEILGDDLELLNSDDDADITQSALRSRDEVPAARSQTRQSQRKQAVVLEDDEYEEEEADEGVEDEETEEYDDGLDDGEQPVQRRPKDDYKYGKEQVQAIIKTRVGTINRRVEKLQPYKQAFDRISEITGMDVNQLITRLNSMSEQEQATILGIPVEQVRVAKQTKALNTQAQTENQKLKRQLDEQALKADKRYSDYDLYKDEIDDVLEDNPKLSVKQAYLLVKGDTATTAAIRDAEQRAVNKQVIARQKGIVKPSGASSGAQGPKLSNEIISAAKAIGMDPVEYARYQAIDNIDSYRKLKQTKNRKE
jgi:hypothetical protein